MLPSSHSFPMRSWSRRAAGLLAVIIVLLATSLLAGCSWFQPETELPVPLKDYIPPEWRLLPAKRGQLDIQEVNIDGDDAKEWMIFYFYDNVPNGANGPVGGVIYDVQQDTTPYNPISVTVPFPYQPSAFLVPYRLLPDWRDGKGQGYLGDVNVTWQQHKANPDPTVRENDELVVFGQGPGGVVTRVSIFWWEGLADGYGVEHFKGSHHVKAEPQSEGGGDDVTQWIPEVTTFNRLNERSNFCERVVYKRLGRTHDFEVSSPATIVFCQGTPKAVPDDSGLISSYPAYPEAVVLAWLLEWGNNDHLVMDGYVDRMQNAVIELGLEQPTRVLSLTYDAVATRVGGGNEAVSTVKVHGVVETPAGQERLWWHLTEKRPKDVRDSAEWRIDGVGRDS